MAGLHKSHQTGQQGSHLLGIVVVMESQTLTPNTSLPGFKPGSAIWNSPVSIPRPPPPPQSTRSWEGGATCPEFAGEEVEPGGGMVSGESGMKPARPQSPSPEAFALLRHQGSPSDQGKGPPRPGLVATLTCDT